MGLQFMYITNNIEIGLIAEKAGVEWIWVDLERLGKEARQKNMNTVKSNHSFQDIKNLKAVLTKSKVLVRIDPLNVNSRSDIETCIKMGADSIMLPMFKEPWEVKRFIEYIDGRTNNMLLLETKEAVNNLDKILSIYGIDEIHIGLNDLSLSYGMKFMFEPMINGLTEEISEKIHNAGIPLGIGGIARIGEGMLPAEKIITEHKRQGSSRAILSRSFCELNYMQSPEAFKREFFSGIRGIKDWEDILEYVGNEYLEKNYREVKEIVEAIVKDRERA